MKDDGSGSRFCFLLWNNIGFYLLYHIHTTHLVDVIVTNLVIVGGALLLTV